MGEDVQKQQFQIMLKFQLTSGKKASKTKKPYKQFRYTLIDILSLFSITHMVRFQF
jgi:hypothetical protein